jgi:hypothetical protein
VVVSPRSRCAVPVRAPQVPVRVRSFPPRRDPRAPAPPSRPPTGRRPSPAGSDAAPGAPRTPHRPGSRPLAREVPDADETSSHGRTAAGAPCIGPTPPRPRTPCPPVTQRPSASAAVSPASGLARFASTHTLRPHLGGRTWCNRSCAVKVLPGTGLTMGVHRARLTFPCKVGHFFKSAGPLRADLVKIRNASRPGHVIATEPARMPAAAAGRLARDRGARAPPYPYRQSAQGPLANWGALYLITRHYLINPALSSAPSIFGLYLYYTLSTLSPTRRPVLVLAL